MVDTIFVPALVGQFKLMIHKYKTWKGKQINSFSKDSLFYHPYLLTSAWWEKDWQKRRHPHQTMKEILKTREGLTFFGDSGGFQAAKKSVPIEVDDTIRWQIANCDLGISPDLPPNTIRFGGDVRPATDEFFVMRMNQTHHNCLLALKEMDRLGKSVPIYNAMHGTTIERRDLWYNKMRDINFPYLALATKPAYSPLAYAFALAHIHSKGYNGKLHVLGVGGATVLPLLVYTKDWFEEVTFDSSTYGNGARLRELYLTPTKSIMLSTKIKDPKAREFKEKVMIDGLECKCHTCRTIDKHEVEILWMPGSISGALITNHNLEMMIEYNNHINDIHAALSKKEYKEYLINELLQNSMPNELNLAFNFLDEYIKNGLADTYRRYRRVMLIDEHRTVEQQKLF